MNTAIKQKTFTSIRWTTIGSISRTLLGLAQIVILTRLLMPEDYGLMAIITAIIGIAMLVSDFGVNIAFVQCQDVTEEQRSSLFWFNVLVGLGLTMILVVSSPVFSWLFSDERLTPLIMLSSSVFLIIALSSQVKLAAEKALNFKPVVIVEIVSSTIGLLVGIAMAYGGWGVYALVFAAISTSIASTTFFWVFLSQGWRPLWRMKLVDLRPFIRFGTAVVANNIVRELHSRLDIFLGGRLLGADALGIYSVPRNMVMQVQSAVNPIITRVGFPLIAQAQFDVSRVRAIYLKTIRMVASVSVPIYLYVSIFSSEVVTVLLGMKWHGAGTILSFLALWGAVRSLGNPVGSLLMGTGRASLALRWNSVLLLVTPFFYWLGSQYGPEGLAKAMFAMSLILFVPGWYFLVRPSCHAGLLEYSASALKPFLLAGVAFVPAYIAATQLEMAIVRLAVGATIGGPLYLLLSYRFNREWSDAMLELLGIKGDDHHRLKGV